MKPNNNIRTEASECVWHSELPLPIFKANMHPLAQRAHCETLRETVEPPPTGMYALEISKSRESFAGNKSVSMARLASGGKREARVRVQVCARPGCGNAAVPTVQPHSFARCPPPPDPNSFLFYFWL